MSPLDSERNVGIRQLLIRQLAYYENLFEGIHLMGKEASFMSANLILRCFADLP